MVKNRGNLPDSEGPRLLHRCMGKRIMSGFYSDDIPEDDLDHSCRPSCVIRSDRVTLFPVPDMGFDSPLLNPCIPEDIDDEVEFMGTGTSSSLIRHDPSPQGQMAPPQRLNSSIRAPIPNNQGVIRGNRLLPPPSPFPFTSRPRVRMRSTSPEVRN